MRIVVNSKSEKFVKEYIPQVLKGYVINRYNMKKAAKINAFLQSININVPVRTILIYAIDTLRFGSSTKGYIVEVDKNRMYPGTNLNIDTLVKLITYGTLNVRGYDILEKAFGFIVRKLNTLMKVYTAKNIKKGE